MDENLLIEVRCHFPHGPRPYTSAKSPDKPRYHVYSRISDSTLLFDTEDAIKEFIGYEHLKIAAEFIEFEVY